jgi:hypothetical protein
MIDFTNCPKDKVWLLFDDEGNSKRITTDTELYYARLETASKKLEGYYLIREGQQPPPKGRGLVKEQLSY